MKPTRQSILAAGVRNLKEFGYPAVNAENILTDYVYSSFFKSMLEDIAGKVPEAAALLKEIKPKEI